MKKICFLFFLVFNAISIFGQNPDGNYNPQVTSAQITPTPLLPVEASGAGSLSFTIGNTGGDPLDVFTDQFIILTITLSGGVPSTADAADAISGDFAGRFSWTYDAGTYTGQQTQSIGSGSSGTISIAYRVTSDSKSESPGNGFTVNLTPAPYQTGSNMTSDDVTSAFTFTEIKDFGDAPESYGAAEHTIDFSLYMGSLVDGEPANQPSADATADDVNGVDDEDGVTIGDLVQGRSAAITVTVTGSGRINAWIDWNNDGVFSGAREHVITDENRTDGTFDFSINVPADAVIADPVFARFRFGPRDLTPSGSANSGEVEDYRVQVSCDRPAAPTIGTITDPTCSTPTGSVSLSGLPSGSWTLIRNPGAIEITGSGTTFTVTSLPAGTTYTFSVRNSVGCTSDPSGNVVISAAPSEPGAPVAGTITQPDCNTATGSVALSGLPSGSWTINPGGIAGAGTTTVISGLDPGTYNFTVTTSGNCTSPESDNIVITQQPSTPAQPDVSVDCSLGFGHALITVTSPIGSGLQYRLNNGVYQSTRTFEGVNNGTYTVTVRNAAGCTATGPEFVVLCSCISPPSVTLTSQSSSVCGTDTPVTVNGNVFGGSATGVTITENGTGTVTPSSTATSPFSFTYTPGVNDAGETVIITLTTNNPLGFPCTPATATYTLTVNSHPPTPSVENIIHPTCTVSTGSVVLGNLPSGSWTITRNPGAIETTGNGSSTTISGLLPGTYTFSVARSSGCSSLVPATVVINSPPPLLPAPVIGTITHPTCSTPTGSVELSGLPSTGLWSLLRNPDGVIITGSRSSRVISGIPAGTYTFTVTNDEGCVSSESAQVVMHEQPVTPEPPVTGSITQPGCTVPTGSIIFGSLPATGSWTLTRYPGSIETAGSGPTATVTGLNPGTYNFTITNASGCTSGLTQNILIADQPVTPEPPVIGSITQPSCTVSTGIVNINGLPARNNWTLTLGPGGEKIYGIGSNTAVPNLLPGTYNLTVTSSEGCTSAPSVDFVIIPNPEAPEVLITQPDTVCSPATIDLTAPSITAGSTANLTYTYWSNPAATIPYSTPGEAHSGKYYIKGTTSSGCSDIKPVFVVIRTRPTADAGSSQVLEFKFETNLNGNIPAAGERGTWSLFKGTGQIDDKNNPRTFVSNLNIGKNIFVWVVTNDVCSPVYDSMTVEVHDITIPSLITPNNDGKNDYLIIRGIEEQGKSELTIFDRSGVMVYENKNYDNKWNGVDYNGDPLPDDTYFYLIKTDGKARTGFIVLRK